eukprot:1357760-Amorphochlora_amoeboformis.AAC.2
MELTDISLRDPSSLPRLLARVHFYSSVIAARAGVIEGGGWGLGLSAGAGLEAGARARVVGAFHSVSLPLLCMLPGRNLLTCSGAADTTPQGSPFSERAKTLCGA